MPDDSAQVRMKNYAFVDEWRLAAEPAQIWAVVRQVEGWSDWWPSVRRVDRLDGPGETGPEAWRFTFQTRLPYAIIFETAIVTEDPFAVAVAGNGDMVAVRLSDDDLTTLKYFYRENGKVRLQPANPTMQAIIIDDPKQVEVQGKVVLVIRHLQ